MSRLRTWWPAALGVLALVLTGLLAIPDAEDTPLDPSSPGPRGALGIVEVMRELGYEVALGGDEPADTILVLDDRLGDEARARLRAEVAAGARLVVADPSSPLAGVRPTGQAPSDAVGTTVRSPECAWAALADVEAVRAATWLGVEAVDPEAVETRCFPVAGGHAILVQRSGEGRTVVVSTPEVFTNLRLGEEDNAQLVVGLLAADGTRSVRVVLRPPPGSGDLGLLDLVADRVWVAMGIAALAFVLLAWTRARRLGEPVAESMPVRVPGSELVHATGALLHRSGAREAAAVALRRRARADLYSHLDIDVNGDPAEAAHAVAAALDQEAAGILAALTRAPTDDADLAATASTLARIRSRLPRTAGRTRSPSDATDVHPRPRADDHPGEAQ